MVSGRENACAMSRLRPHRANTALLIDSYADAMPCPLKGIYTLSYQLSASRCPYTVEIGCSTPSSVVLKECDMISKFHLLYFARYFIPSICNLIATRSRNSNK